LSNNPQRITAWRQPMRKESPRPSLSDSQAFRTFVAIVAVVIACVPFLLEMISRWFG
jgi:hypothetical protein